MPAAGTLAFATASETLEDALQMPNAARAIIAVKRIRMDCRADQAQQIARPPMAAACGPHYVRNCLTPKIFGGRGKGDVGPTFVRLRPDALVEKAETCAVSAQKHWGKGVAVPIASSGLEITLREYLRSTWTQFARWVRRKIAINTVV